MDTPPVDTPPVDTLPVDTLHVDTFVEEHLRPGRPVLVRQARSAWGSPPPWHLDWLTERFGGHKVPLYDTLFKVNGVTTFSRYVARYTGPAVSGAPPYLRWFVRQDSDDLPWSDAVFGELQPDWAAPDWLPDGEFAFPSYRRADPTRDPFPGKGLFVCGRGGRTRLHVDPWVTDACLYQVTGTKRLILFAPSCADRLTRDGAVVDLDAPDDERFPRWRAAVPALDEVLHPGDVAFIPSGWFHAAEALEDSVSITWNFVHRTHEARFARYLDEGGSANPTVRYFRSLPTR